MAFRRAERRRAKLRIALDGPSGSGKTHSALRLAAGLGDKVALIDTERGSGEMEAGKPGIPEYDACPLEEPFHPKKYINAIHEAESAGYDVIIIDSLSHAWSGAGGILDMTDKAKASQRNKFAAWRETTPIHNMLVDAILQSKAHVIATIRTKTAWDFEEDEKGRKKPVKIGLKPEQREGIEYEFTLVLDIMPDKHIATASKDRTSLFATEPPRREMLTDQHGKELREWIESGAEPVKNPQQKADAETRGPTRLESLYQWATEHEVDTETWRAMVREAGITKDRRTHTQNRLDDLEGRIHDCIAVYDGGGDLPPLDDDPPETDEEQPANPDAVSMIRKVADNLRLADSEKGLVHMLRLPVGNQDLQRLEDLTAEQAQKALDWMDEKFAEASQERMD